MHCLVSFVAAVVSSDNFLFSAPITLNWNNLITLRAFGTIIEHNVFVYRELTAKNKTKDVQTCKLFIYHFPLFLALPLCKTCHCYQTLCSSFFSPLTSLDSCVSLDNYVADEGKIATRSRSATLKNKKFCSHPKILCHHKN